MNDAAAMRSGRDRLLNLVLVEDDRIFRMGLRACLQNFADLRVVAEVETPEAVLNLLQSQRSDEIGSSLPIDLIVLDLDLGRVAVGKNVGLVLCQQLKAQYRTMPVLLLSHVPDPALLVAALQTGAEGYCAKAGDIETLVEAVRQVAAGQRYWDQEMQAIARSFTSPRSPQAMPAMPSGILSDLRSRLRSSGIRQIEVALAEVTQQISEPGLSLLDRAILAGRRRELRSARWLVNRLLTPGSALAPVGQPSPVVGTASAALTQIALGETLPATPSVATSDLATPPSPGDYRQLQAALFDRTFDKVQSGLQNLTHLPLEIDILREDKRRALLLVILRQVEALLEELRFSQVQPEQLAEKRGSFLLNLWQMAMTEFFGKYYTLQVGQQAIEVVRVLEQDAAIVESAILDKIPQLPQWFASLLFQAPLVIDNVAYPIGTPEALNRAEDLLQNLTIQMANAVIQPLLNHFADVEAVKQGFYDRRLLSTREIERFRNNLSWQYRVDRWVGEPKAIFESQFRLLVLADRSIKTIQIYAPRNEELMQLSGIQYTVTLALEARDAISPRLRSAVAFLGSGIVYLLTDVVGRGIGLVGRGILKGIGNALQDNRLGRNSER
jgi:DNA-binding NarL/FixJ family response regulator